MKAAVLPRFRMPRLGRAPQLIALALIVGLVGAMAIEPTRQLLLQRDRIDQMTADLTHIERTNERLQARIERLNDPDFLEQRAREQIGLVRPGEITYVVMPPSRRDRAREARKHRPEPPAPPAPSFFEAVLAFVGFL